jgi:phosphopantothenoylcysteine decarboxylase/phosphopantothenate--cysteine ligase
VKGKRILLGLTGGIAAYKAADLTRRLVKAGAGRARRHDRRRGALHHAGDDAGAVGQTVWTDLWDPRFVPDNMGHIELSRDRDLIVVAPATADFLAKLANGLADDLLSGLCMARRCPWWWRLP